MGTDFKSVHHSLCIKIYSMVADGSGGTLTSGALTVYQWCSYCLK